MEETREAQHRLTQARADVLLMFPGEMLLHPKHSKGEKGLFSPCMKNGAQLNNLTQENQKCSSKCSTVGEVQFNQNLVG